MKRLFFILPLVFLLQACPIGIEYPMAELDKENINQKLVGIWENPNSSAEVIKVEFTKNSTKTQLRAKVLQRGEMYAMDTDDFTVYQTILNGRNFLIFKPDNEAKYYHYQYEMDDNTITFHDVSLLVEGVDAATSTEALRNEINLSMAKEGYGSEVSTMTRVKN